MSLLLVLTTSATIASAVDLRSRAAEGLQIADVILPGQGKTGFTRLDPAKTGLHFTNTLAESRSLTNHILLNGSGVAAGDVDADGWTDLYLCRLDGPNALYRNRGGWRFEEVAEEAGVSCPGIDTTGAVMADIDGDGDLDLLVSAIRGGVSCFVNDGAGRFRDFTESSGLASNRASMSLSLADIDGDSDLDLYVANYRNTTVRDAFRMQIRVNQVDGRRVITRVNGRPVTDPDLADRFTIEESGAISENGQADTLYRNDGTGRFSPLSFVDGIFLDEDGRRLATPPFDWTLTAMFRDLNEDGFPDLYVCSDMNSADRIWLNRRDGTFQAAPRLSFRKTSWFSMGLDCGDLNRDGYDEIFVTDMVSRDHRMRQVQVSDHQPVLSRAGVFENRPQSPRNTLFYNCGDGDYLEIAYFAGLEASEWSWSPVLLDVDLDGYEDILISTGFERDVQDIDIANELEAIRREARLTDADALRMRRRFPRLDLENLAFRNRGDLTFEEMGKRWGFDTKGVSQGTTLADLDNDGDLDVIVNNMNGGLGVYRNDSVAPRLAVRLRGRPPNTGGVGARITVFGGAVPRQSQQVICGGRYLSGDDGTRVFAAGSLTNRMKVEVVWAGGQRSIVKDVSANQLVRIDEAYAQDAPKPVATAQPTLFEDVSHLISHRHHEEDYDDFARQPLLPKKLSQLGPGLAWYDLDRDGWEDLIIGSGKGGQLGVFRNDGRGGFQRFRGAPVGLPVPRDLTAVIGYHPSPNRPLILAGAASYEDASTAGSAVVAYDLRGVALDVVVAERASSTGPLALADIDADGDLDLFVGGRVLPGRFPEPATSTLFRNQDGRWVEDASIRESLTNTGLVSGAVFTDLDGDGYPELVLACEWGPPRVLRNERGQGWHETTRELGLHGYRGWWNGVTSGDFDGDGRMDLVLSNWGTNTRYEASVDRPQRLYYGDISESGGVDLLEAYYFEPMDKIVPWRHLGRVGSALPSVRARFSTFRAFGTAGISEILNGGGQAVQELRASCLESMVFLNRTDRFEAHPLPAEAQWSPAFGVCVGDLDGDGHEDIFLAQNFFATEPETGRYDGGRGLWLKGDGRGAFGAVPGRKSGIRIYGEQRGAALSDFDADGRLDVAVAQNGTETKLYRNARGRPGLRVRVRGPEGNPDGIGAVVRVYSNGRFGPAREIHAGSGYWSQDGAVLVLGTPTGVDSIWIRWPGGTTTSSAVPAEASEITVQADGRADVLGRSSADQS